MNGNLLLKTDRPPFFGGPALAGLWRRRGTGLALGMFLAVCVGADTKSDPDFRQHIEPLLKQYCYDCHGDGEKRGDVSLDSSDEAAVPNPNLWFRVLKNVRSGLMPPAKKPHPSPEELLALERWIKTTPLAIDPHNLDPGKVTVRRMNRIEYRNTIRDLMGVDFETDKEFPADDAGFGFDNIGDVLTLSPLLLEKYVSAARAIVTRAVPSVPWEPAQDVFSGQSFRYVDNADGVSHANGSGGGGSLRLSYYEPARVARSWAAPYDGTYHISLDLEADERFVDDQFDYNECRLTFSIDGKVVESRKFAREAERPFHFEFDQDWAAGQHQFTIDMEPLTPDQRRIRSLNIRLDSLTIRGPADPKHWIRPRNFSRYFSQDAPSGDSERRDYAHRLLKPFAERAYRRPVDEETMVRLVTLAETFYSQPETTFEGGIRQAMVAILASPRFLFREEGMEQDEPVAGGSESIYPRIDEFALASRLSYFLWSSMPDEELLRLAGEHRLRKELMAQWHRMLADSKSGALVRNFVGQWLQARDIETVAIDGRQVLSRESAPDAELERRRARLRELRQRPEGQLNESEAQEFAALRADFANRGNRQPTVDLNYELRRSMRQETERTFDYVLHQDRSCLELLSGGYTFLNERLARHYGLTNLDVRGEEMRRVQLPPDSPRGGILTQGTVLAVTSNPTRTSPVKRGLFILDNVLGAPPPPPPPDVPALEDAAKGVKDRTLTLRETLALHREKPLCSSCHNRMDPLGLALENFNALGIWREQERGQPIDVAGQLLTGERFADIRELKQILAERHRVEFYRTLAQKLLTYALGRGLDYYDVGTVDELVDQLVQHDGHPSALLAGIIESSPFQRTRRSSSSQQISTPNHRATRADARIQP